MKGKKGRNEWIGKLRSFESIKCFSSFFEFSQLLAIYWLKIICVKKCGIKMDDDNGRVE